MEFLPSCARIDVISQRPDRQFGVDQRTVGEDRVVEDGLRAVVDGGGDRVVAGDGVEHQVAARNRVQHVGEVLGCGHRVLQLLESIGAEHVGDRRRGEVVAGWVVDRHRVPRVVRDLCGQAVRRRDALAQSGDLGGHAFLRRRGEGPHRGVQVRLRGDDVRRRPGAHRAHGHHDRVDTS
jgi:hypothetical protein